MQRRLFYAIPIDERLGQAIAAWRRKLPLEGARPSPLSHLHLTLKFLGATDEARLPELLAVGARIAADPFTLKLDSVSLWRHAGVLVLEAQRIPPPLTALVHALEEELAALGYARESRPYRPHVTLARHCRSPVAAPPASFSVKARRFSLYESRDGQYLPLGTWPLPAPAPA